MDWNPKKTVKQRLKWACLLAVIGCVGCGKGMMYDHHSLSAISDHHTNYYHSSKTGKIIPKDPCGKYCELGCFGYQPTTWTHWPQGCPGNYPVQGEVVSDTLAPVVSYEGQVIMDSAAAEGLSPQQSVTVQPEPMTPPSTPPPAQVPADPALVPSIRLPSVPTDIESSIPSPSDSTKAAMPRTSGVARKLAMLKAELPSMPATSTSVESPISESAEQQVTTPAEVAVRNEDAFTDEVELANPPSTEVAPAPFPAMPLMEPRTFVAPKLASEETQEAPAVESFIEETSEPSGKHQESPAAVQPSAAPALSLNLPTSKGSGWIATSQEVAESKQFVKASNTPDAEKMQLPLMAPTAEKTGVTVPKTPQFSVANRPSSRRKLTETKLTREPLSIRPKVAVKTTTKPIEAVAVKRPATKGLESAQSPKKSLIYQNLIAGKITRKPADQIVAKKETATPQESKSSTTFGKLNRSKLLAKPVTNTVQTADVSAASNPNPTRKSALLILERSSDSEIRFVSGRAQARQRIDTPKSSSTELKFR